MLQSGVLMRTTSNFRKAGRDERGGALLTSLIIMSLLAAVSMTVLAVVTHESRIAGSDLRRTQTFYAAAASSEKMTSDFSALFTKTSHPTQTQLNAIAANYPSELVSEGFSFSKPDGSANQSITVDAAAPAGLITIPTGAFSGLMATVNPYLMDTTVRQTASGAEVHLQRRINNYLVPIFQFGMFSNEDIELYPLPSMAINGRVHANGNIYASGFTSMTFQAKVTTAGEFVTDVWRNGTAVGSSNVFMKVGSINVPITMGSMVNGPNISGTTTGQRGFWPGSPNGTINSSWNTTSVAAAQTGVANQFGGQLITRSTGGAALLLPMQIEGNFTREIIKRRLPSDTLVLSNSRYHSKAEVRILLDDEGVSGDAAGISAGGVNLSTFVPDPLPNTALNASINANGGGRALWRILDNNTNVNNSYNETTTSYVLQAQPSPSPAIQADTVRSTMAPP